MQYIIRTKPRFIGGDTINLNLTIVKHVAEAIAFSSPDSARVYFNRLAKSTQEAFEIVPVDVELEERAIKQKALAHEYDEG